MIDINEIKFNSDGLIPAIVVNHKTGKVLMQAYMNRESLEISMEKKKCCFYSRSRQQLWTKGETSGNYMDIVSITADCDRDSLLIKVDPEGPACHLGTESCFEYPLFGEDEEKFTLESLYELIKGRKTEKKEGQLNPLLMESRRWIPTSSQKKHHLWRLLKKKKSFRSLRKSVCTKPVQKKPPT